MYCAVALLKTFNGKQGGNIFSPISERCKCHRKKAFHSEAFPLPSHHHNGSHRVLVSLPCPEPSTAVNNLSGPDSSAEEEPGCEFDHISTLYVMQINVMQVREGRQLTSGERETILEGDILVRNTSLDSSALDAHLADPDRLWPSGLVEYKFYKSFPTSSQKTVKRAMTYITTRVPCITFEEATTSTVDYVLFRDGLKCNSELGRTGGEQVINLNRCIFD